MSRLAKKPINIPDGVEVNILNNEIKCKGPLGELSFNFDRRIKIIKEDKKIILKTVNDVKINDLLGTTYIIIKNMILGVKDKFEKKLEIIGVGYRAQAQGKKLVLNLGFSHPLELEAPAGIEFKVQKNTISILGSDRQSVGAVAAKIRDLKKPEPYKGKGIRYNGEYVRKKAGKKAVTTGAA